MRRAVRSCRCAIVRRAVTARRCAVVRRAVAARRCAAWSIERSYARTARCSARSVERANRRVVRSHRRAVSSRSCRNDAVPGAVRKRVRRAERSYRVAMYAAKRHCAAVAQSPAICQRRRGNAARSTATGHRNRPCRPNGNRFAGSGEIVHRQRGGPVSAGHQRSTRSGANHRRSSPVECPHSGDRSGSDPRSIAEASHHRVSTGSAGNCRMANAAADSRSTAIVHGEVAVTAVRETIHA